MKLDTTGDTRRTVTAIICFNKKLLFFKRDNIPNISDPDKWQFPGGHIKIYESPDKAIRRELLEEVSFVPISLVHVWTLNTKKQETHVYWSYVTSIEAKKFKLGTSEGQLIKFMSVNKALTLNLTSNVRYYLVFFQELILKCIENKTIPTAPKLVFNKDC